MALSEHTVRTTNSVRPTVSMERQSNGELSIHRMAFIGVASMWSGPHVCVSTQCVVARISTHYLLFQIFNHPGDVY